MQCAVALSQCAEPRNFRCGDLQGQGAAPSAPPLPTAPPAQGGTPPGPPRSDADFWKRALNTPIETVPGRMGGHVNYPDVYKATGSPAAYAAAAPYEKSALATAPVRPLEPASHPWPVIYICLKSLSVGMFHRPGACFHVASRAAVLHTAVQGKWLSAQ